MKFAAGELGKGLEAGSLVLKVRVLCKAQDFAKLSVHTCLAGKGRVSTNE
jgi:hypothetical protein